MSRPSASVPLAVGIVLQERHELRPPRQRSPPVLVEIGQDGVEPAPEVTAEKTAVSERSAPHQRILHQIVGDIGVARERARIAAQRWDHVFDTLAKCAHFSSVLGSSTLCSLVAFTIARRRRLTKHNTLMARAIPAVRVAVPTP